MTGALPTPYLHGSSAQEQGRLELMNGLLEAGSLELLGLTGSERVLELGAGTALFARAMARALPRGRVLGIERDERQLARGREVAAETPNLELRQGDAASPPLSEDEWSTFDVVHARFLLEHVERPLDVVRAMVRAASPGGRLVLVDDDHSLLRMWPEPDGVLELWEVYVAHYAELGLDPFVGRKLVALLAQAGAVPARSSVVYYGGCSGEPHFPGLVENLACVFAGVADRLATAGPIPRSEIQERIARLRRWGEGKDHFLCYALPWVEGRRPAQS